MAIPILPADGDNPWGATIRAAITDVSNRADTALSDIDDINTDLDSTMDQVATNTTTIASHTSSISTLNSTVATKAADNAVVKLTGNQNISGTKTFSTAPVVPDNSFEIAKINGLQSALNAKAPLASPTFTGTVGGITKAMVGLANVDNTTDLNKPISTATQAALNLKANSTDVDTSIQTHNHTGGAAGVNIPISAVTGLQTSLNTITTNANGREPALRIATAGGGDLTLNTSDWTFNYVYMRRVGSIAYINFNIVSKKIISNTSNGNIGNIDIAQFKTTSEFSHIYVGTSNSNQDGMRYSLNSLHAGLSATGYISWDGSIALSAVSPGPDLAAGYNLTLGGFFFLDNSTG
jgi:hypothetical protein